MGSVEAREHSDRLVLGRLSGSVRLNLVELAESTGLTRGQARTVLVRLEAAGKVRREGGMWESAR